MISYLIKLNNVDLTPWLKNPGGFKFTPAKLASDAGRNMAGSLKFTHIGIFPKISLTFVSMTREEIRPILALLDQPSFAVLYYNEATDSVKAGTYYAGDYDYSIMGLDRDRYDEFTVNLISIDKRT